MPRRRFITIVSLTAAVLACGAITYFAGSRRAEPYFQGRSASYWLREVSMQQSQALEAFRQMGTNAEPILVAAIEGKEYPLGRMYRRVYSRLPGAIRQRWPQPDESKTLRLAAVFVVLNSPASQIVPKVLPLLKDSDNRVSQAVEYMACAQISPPNSGQVPFLILACNDPNFFGRREALDALGRIGRSATSAVPILLNLCADKDMDVRINAAVALWRITGQTNQAVPVLEGLLAQSQEWHSPHWAAIYLLQMGKSDPQWITALINSLTNGLRVERFGACALLSQIGPPAAAAIPALRRALQDPDAIVRKHAKWALIRIDPKHATADSP
jgi:hypothetical protein